MTKFFNVKDARLMFEKRDDLIMKLYHPDHGVFKVADVDNTKRAIVYFYKDTKLYEVFADECICNYSFKDLKQTSNPITQDRLDVCYKILSVKAVLTAQFLQIYGLENRYKEFLQKFSDKIKDHKSDEKI